MQQGMYLFNLGRAPVYANVSALFLLFFCLTAYAYLPAPQMLAMGFVYALGVFASIILHEYGHSLAGRAFKIETQAIELHGLGGFCHFARSSRTRLQSIAIALAGPLVNLILFFLAKFALSQMLQFNIHIFHAQTASGATPWPHMLVSAVADFGIANYIMFIFNLLPAFPLDGGRALQPLLSYLMKDNLAARCIASCGVALGLMTLALIPRFGIGIVFIGLYLLFENYQAFQGTK